MLKSQKGDFGIMLQKKETIIFHELLDLLDINAATLQDIVSSIARQPKSTFVLKRASGDMSIFYFEDENQHIFPISIQKLVEVKNLLMNMTGGVY